MNPQLESCTSIKSTTLMKTTIRRRNPESKLKKGKRKGKQKEERDRKRVPYEGLAIERLIFGVGLRRLDLGSVETLASAMEEVGI